VTFIQLAIRVVYQNAEIPRRVSSILHREEGFIIFCQRTHISELWRIVSMTFCTDTNLLAVFDAGELC